MPRAKASRGAMMRNRAAAVGHGRQGGAAGLGIDRRTGGRQRGTTVSFYGHNYYAKRGDQEDADLNSKSFAELLDYASSLHAGDLVVEKVWQEKLADAKERWRVEKTDRDKQADELIEMISHSEAQKQQEEEDPECLYEDLEFAERHIPDEGAERCSFMVYVLFLALFMFHTVHGRPHAYHFAQYARDVGDVDDFMEIDDIIDYKDW